MIEHAVDRGREATAVDHDARKQPQSAGKNIVLCCDGTSNEFSADKTNVVKLFQALDYGPYQVSYYHPGLGTMEAAGAVTSIGRKVTKWLGLAIGYGLERDIGDAYVFLMRHHERGDKVFLFGFSRGAYTVRALASLLHMYGLMRPGNEAHVPYAVRMLFAAGKRARADGDAPPPQGKDRRPENPFRTAREFKATFSRPCPLAFVGLWDTVSSIGWFYNPRSLPYTRSNRDIAVGRHAIAIDERRGFFRQNLWDPSKEPWRRGPRDLKQLWFPGSHGDVGGGYPEKESGLSDIALQWMLREAAAHGLALNKRGARLLKAELNSGAPAPIHDSLVPKWWIAEFVPKRRFEQDAAGTWRATWGANLFRARRLPKDAQIHVSGYARGDDYVRTRNLPAGPGCQ